MLAQIGAHHLVVGAGQVTAVDLFGERFEGEVTAQLEGAFGSPFGAKIVEGVEEATDEVDLVVLGIEGPGAAENDQLDLVDRVPVVVVRQKTAQSLAVRVEIVLSGPLRARLAREVTFGHAYVVRAEDTFARTREGFGQYRHRRDPARGTHRLHSQPCHQLVFGEPEARCQMAETPNQFGLRKGGPARFGMAPQQTLQLPVLERSGGPQGLDQGDKLAFVAGGVEDGAAAR